MFFLHTLCMIHRVVVYMTSATAGSEWLVQVVAIRHDISSASFTFVIFILCAMATIVMELSLTSNCSIAALTSNRFYGLIGIRAALHVLKRRLRSGLLMHGDMSISHQV